MRVDVWFRRAQLATGLVIVYIFLLTAFNVWKPRVLILHSFSQSLRLVRDTDDGIRKTLAANRMPINVRWYYLNRDRNDVDAMGNAVVVGAESGTSPGRVKCSRVSSFGSTILIVAKLAFNIGEHR